MMHSGRVGLLIAALWAATAGAAETPGAADVLGPIGFGAGAQQQVLGGQLVEQNLASQTPRDLAVAFAFLVRQPPARLDWELVHGALLRFQSPGASGLGELPDPATPASLAALSLAESERSLYAGARAGEDLNLSSAELAALKAAGGGADALEAALRKLLLDRLAAYRSRGLAGIAPYARGGGRQTAAGDELRRLSSSLPAIERIDPAVFRFIQSYPEGQVPKLVESFYWSHFPAAGSPTLALSHLFSSALGEAYVFVHRDFYVSRSYNAGQGVASFLPVKEGTLVVYTNHVSTDQVEGFGGSARRSVGERMMASRLRELFTHLQESATKP